MRSYDDYRKILELWEQGYNKLQIANMINIPRATVRDIIFRYGSVAKLRELEDQEKSRREEEWESRLSDATFRENYSYLLGVYLGDGHIAKEPRTYKFRIFQDTQYPNIIQGYIQTLSVIMPKNKVTLYYHKKDKAVDVICLSNLWPQLFPQHGIGRKHERQIELEIWQQEIVSEYPKAFIKGLIHTDGCRIEPVINGTIYSRYQFTNVSEDIRRLFCMACEIIGVHCTVYKRNITIARRKDVELLDSFIGPKS
jgi:hypothetical protein